MNKGIIIAIVVVLAIGGGIFFLTQNNQPVPQTTTQTDTQNTNTQEGNSVQNQEASPSGAMADGEVKEITVEGSNFKFMPTEIRVKTGDKVRIVFKNTEGFHDFVIDEFDVATKQIQADNTDIVEFTADKAGSYEYYCSVGQHRQMGMKGTLIVE